MADINIKRITIYIYFVIGLTESIKLERNAFNKLLSGKTELVLEKVPDAEKNSVLSKIQTAYNDRQKKVFDDLVQAASGVKDASKVEGNCEKCMYERSYSLYCYAKCMTDEASMSDYAKPLAAVYDTFICKPIAFRFFEKYFKNDSHPMWRSLDGFAKVFNTEEMAKEVMTEIWFGNLALLDRSPLYFYAVSQARVRKVLIEDGTIVDVDNLPDREFADGCTQNYARDVAPVMQELVSKASEKPYLLDILLRGLFALRSAFFYTIGDHVNGAGAVVEAFNVFTGRKCNWVKDDEGSSSDCDNYGHYPIPQFPIPSEMEKDVGIDCNPDPAKGTTTTTTTEATDAAAAPPAR